MHRCCHVSTPSRKPVYEICRNKCVAPVQPGNAKCSIVLFSLFGARLQVCGGPSVGSAPHHPPAWLPVHRHQSPRSHGRAAEAQVRLSVWLPAINPWHWLRCIRCVAVHQHSLLPWRGCRGAGSVQCLLICKKLCHPVIDYAAYVSSGSTSSLLPSFHRTPELGGGTTQCLIAYQPAAICHGSDTATQVQSAHCTILSNVHSTVSRCLPGLL